MQWGLGIQQYEVNSEDLVLLHKYNILKTDF